MAGKDLSLENEESSGLIKYHYGNETFSLQTTSTVINEAVKNFPQKKHASQTASQQKLRQT